MVPDVDVIDSAPRRPVRSAPECPTAASGRPMTRATVKRPGIEACTLSGAVLKRCRRRVCRQPFTPGRRGSVQEFCSAACRCAFHAEARQLGQRRLGTRAQKTPPADRDAYWRSGIDAATGRRIPVAVRPPWALLSAGVGSTTKHAGRPGRD